MCRECRTKARALRRLNSDNDRHLLRRQAHASRLGQARASPFDRYPGAEVAIGASPLAFNGGISTEVVVTSESSVIGRRGILTLKLDDSTSELGAHLGYWRWATFDLIDASASAWTLD